MTKYFVEATYENGVLKLDQPLPLEDQKRVRVTVFVGPSRTEQSYGLMKWKGSVEDLDYIINDPDIYP